jgi:DNA-binding NarL/FixJ family response regulator
VIAASFIPDAGSAQRPRVLLADDHPAMLALTADMLSSEVWSSMQWAMDANFSLRRSGSTDVIVLDITMPGLDGIEAARQLKTGGRAKLVFLTVHEDPDYVRTALHAAGAAYVATACPACDRMTAIHEALVEHSFALANNFLGRKLIKPKWLSENKTTKRYGNKNAKTAKL